MDIEASDKRETGHFITTAYLAADRVILQQNYYFSKDNAKKN